VLDGRDEALVGRAAGARAEQDQAPALLDHPLALVSLEAEVLAHPAAAASMLCCGQRGLLCEPDQLRVAVPEAGAGCSTLVDPGENVWVAGLAGSIRAQPPGLGDQLQLSFAELRQRPFVLGRVDHHLVMLEGGVLVRDHPHQPAGCIGSAAFARQREHLRRRAVLASPAERARLELLERDRLEHGSAGTRP
jgi:hypothetical protein